MSVVEEDVELQDLLLQTLERNGCLPKLRAQLRASTILALDEDIKLSKQAPLQNLRVQSYLKTPEGKLMFNLVREFLEFFNLKFTIGVYEAEAGLNGTETIYEGRQQIAKDLGFERTTDDATTVPLLQRMLNIAQKKTNNAKTLDINLNVNGSSHEEHPIDDNSNKKTESDHSQHSQNPNSFNQSNNYSSSSFGRDDSSKGGHLNATFHVSSPTVVFNNLPAKCSESSSVNKKSEVNGTATISPKFANRKRATEDDTYEDTSSIAEDIIEPVNNESDDLTPVSLSETTLKSFRNSGSLNDHSTIPSTVNNKTRSNSDILPSMLYSKDFKNKSKELDKLFDLEPEYEEDFSELSSISGVEDTNMNAEISDPECGVTTLNRSNLINHHQNSGSSISESMKRSQ